MHNLQLRLAADAHVEIRVRVSTVQEESFEITPELKKRNVALIAQPVSQK